MKSRNQADFHTLVDCIFSAIRGMPHISNKQFINELSKMHRSVSYLGVVSISFKRYNKGVNCFPSKKDAEPNSKKNRCLVRAVSPHKKISTIVAPNDVASFSNAINSVLRNSITYLKRKQRRGKKDRTGSIKNF